MISNFRLTQGKLALPAADRLISLRTALVSVAVLLILGRAWVLAVELVQSVPSAFIFDEDAYYVFAVARNLASGRGITADGSQWTNGFQPLWTGLVVLPYLVFSDDRLVLGSIAALSMAIWLTSAYVFVRLVCRLSGSLVQAEWVKWAVAVLFLADLQLQSAYFNGLETGLYLLGILALLVWIEPSTLDRPGWQSFGLGAGLGVLTLARNDAIFLAVALLIRAIIVNRSAPALRGVLLAGATMSAVVVPWLAFNVWLSGSPVPQSGAATNAGPYASAVSIDKGAAMLARLAQLTFTPFPMNYVRFQQDSTPAAGILALAAVAICCALIARRALLGPTIRLLWPLAVAAVCLCAYYLVGSGAVWMYDRYLMPFKLLSLSLWAAFLVTLTVGPRSGRAVSVAATLGIVLVSVYYQVFSPSMGSNMTADVLWLESSPLARTDDRIGMFESGRSMYTFPGRIENLDGKVNLAVLRAIQRGTFLEYLDRSDLDVLVFRDYYLPWLDGTYPEWRSVFTPKSDELEGLVVARRTTIPQD